MKNWTHKVVKSATSINGKPFNFPTAVTGTLDECIKYAREFAAEQQAGEVTGVCINVIARKGSSLAAQFRVNVYNSMRGEYESGESRFEF